MEATEEKPSIEPTKGDNIQDQTAVEIEAFNDTSVHEAQPGNDLQTTDKKRKCQACPQNNGEMPLKAKITSKEFEETAWSRMKAYQQKKNENLDRIRKQVLITDIKIR